MQLGSGGAVIPLPAASPGQACVGGPGKFQFYCSKGYRLTYLFIFTENLVLSEERLYKFELTK